MFAVRCTKKLLERMRIDPEADPPESSTVLGDWYANLLYDGKRQLILCVSEKTLLPVVLPAADAREFHRRLPEALLDVLKGLGVSSSASERELREMREVVIGRTASRSVLGTMNDFAFAISFCRREESLTALALWLAETPCKPINMNSPDRETRAAFADALH